MKNKKKVIAAMSGGVDSSVAAAILKNIGYDVVGVFMKFWQEPGKGRENRCCSLEAETDARKVAAKLGIPFYVVDARKEFKKRVVDYFIEEYKKGRTPNPCVECNRWIKFGFLMDKLMMFKADYIATGHYARIQNSKLLTAKDKTKDQSYFLWTLTQKQLRRILFPIGDYKKSEVRPLAKKWGLPVYEKKDSQEICFVNNLGSFLKKHIKIKKGDILTVDDKKVGEHEGLAFYTIGQRKGINIGGIGPFYVVGKDFRKNALIVAQGNFGDALYKKEMIVKKVNWLGGKPYLGKCKVKIRYMTKAVQAVIKKQKIKSKEQYLVFFNENQRAITPGQSAVFYKGSEVLGGGIIEK